MAKIFISYSRLDKDLVNPYTEELRKRGQDILMDSDLLEEGTAMQPTLLKAIEDADGMIVFITEKSVQSANVMSEIGLGKANLDKATGKKFLIPLVTGTISVPYIIGDLLPIILNPNTIREDVTLIITQIERFEAENKQNPENNPVTENKPFPSPGSSSSDPGRAPDQEPPNSQDGSSIPAAPAYWVLRINGSTWPIDQFSTTVDNEYYFHSHNFYNDQTNDDYELFQKVKTGDLLLAYAFSSFEALVAIFEATKPLGMDPLYGEVIHFRLIKVISPPYTLGLFSSKPPFSDPSFSGSNNKLFILDKVVYEDLVKEMAAASLGTVDPPGTPSPYFNKTNLSEIFTDSAAAEIEDKLDFIPDINALASIIAYQEVKPPLAIGLFGNWGSGKSFFMNKLQKQVKFLADRKKDPFCQEVVQINFNSWHYSDANLWASLITKIFDDLEKYGRSDSSKLQKLFENLNSTQELIKETEQKRDLIGQEILSLKTRQIEVEAEIRTKTENFNSLTTWEITKAVMKNPLVLAELDKLKDAYKPLDIKEYKDIQTNIDLLEKGAGKLTEGLQLVYSFRKGKGWMALLILALVSVGTYFLIHLAKSINPRLEKLEPFIIAAAALVSQLVGFLTPAFKRINEAVVRLKSLRATSEQVKADEQKKFNALVSESKSKLEGALQSQNELRLQVDQLQTRKNQLQLEIDDIVSGKKIVRFIESKVTDERYINSLGIISWIRKDFEELDFLLKQQYDAKKLEELKRAKIEDVFQIDRIILYIDDLDRCDISIVVRVLEAIHLLLAFPLFVVVVGVDPRWMHKALSIKYKEFLSNGGDEGGVPIPPDPLISGRMATSYDYLEKIFQVPFVLRPMDPTGKNDLIKAQFGQKQNEEHRKSPSISSNFPATGNAPGTGNPPAAATMAATIAGIGPSASSPSVPSAGSPPASSATPLVPITPGKEETTAGKEAEIKEELLIVSEDEITFMQSIGFLIGDSPRTIKRYINIYRIIRTHSKFTFQDSNELEHYYAAMTLLAIITGVPEKARSIFASIHSSADTIKFGDFIGKTIVSEVDQEPLLKTLSGKLSQSDQLKLTTDEKVRMLALIPMSKFKVNAGLISRFSFRNLA